MKSSVEPLAYVLVFAVATSIALIAFPWASKQFEISLDKAEMNVIKKDFIDCSKRIIEVARTGSVQKCVFSVSRGDLFVKKDGIYYKLFSRGDICDEHEWGVIEQATKVWQKCEKVQGGKVYWLRWFYPKNDTIVLEGSVTIELPSGKKSVSFENKGYLNVEFETQEGVKGKVIEITRKMLEKDRAILSVKIS